MTPRKTVQDYEICDDFWNKMTTLPPLPKPKKKLGRPSVHYRFRSSNDQDYLEDMDAGLFKYDFEKGLE